MVGLLDSARRDGRGRWHTHSSPGPAFGCYNASMRQRTESRIDRRMRLSGTWWLPEHPETRVRGTLSRQSSDFATLITERGLIPNDQILTHSVTPVIHGQAGSWSRITLLQCHSTNVPFSEERYRVEDVLLAAHTTIGHWRTAIVSFPYLTEWAFQSRWYQAGAVKPPTVLPPIKATWGAPRMLSADAPWGRLHLVADASWHYARDSFSIRRRLTFRLEASTPRTLHEWRHDIVHPLTNLLSLFMETLIRPGTLKLLDFAADELTSEEAGPVVKALSYESQPDRASHFRGHVNSQTMPVPLKDLERKLSRIVKSWWAFYGRFPFLCGLFFGVHNDTQGFWQYQFLAQVQAAELYHRLRVRRYDISEVKHEERLRVILGKTPKGHHKFLKDRLAHSNEMTLRRRLRVLFARAGTLLGPIVPDAKKVIDTVIGRRNEFVHGSADFSLKGPGRYGAFRVIAVLSLLLQYVFLREAGLTRPEAVRALQRTFEYDYARRMERDTRTNAS